MDSTDRLFLIILPAIYLVSFLPRMISLMIARRFLKTRRNEAGIEVTNAIIRRNDYYFIALIPFFVAAEVAGWLGDKPFYYIYVGAAFLITLILIIILWLPKQKNEFEKTKNPRASKTVEVLYGPGKQYFRIGIYLLIFGLLLSVLGAFILFEYYTQSQMHTLVLTLFYFAIILVGIIMITLATRSFKKDSGNDNNSNG